MDLAGQFVGQNLVDHAVALQPRLARKNWRDHKNREVAFARAGRAGMVRMVVGVIDGMGVGAGILGYYKVGMWKG